MNACRICAVFASLLLLRAQACAKDVLVMLPDGSPASGATAVSVTQARFVRIKEGTIVQNYGEKPRILPEDAIFSMPDGDSARWVFLHNGGWADIIIQPDDKEIRLQPWQQVRGLVDRKLPAGTAVASYARTEPEDAAAGANGSVHWTCETKVGDDGGFELEKVPSGPGIIGLVHEEKSGRSIQRWRDFPTRIQVPDGQPVQLGGKGIEVRGRLDKELESALVTLLDRACRRPPCFGTTREDGSFTIPGVPPGDYRIVFRPIERGKGSFHIQKDISVDGAHGTLDLGDFQSAKLAPEIEIHDQVEYPEGLISRVESAAAQQTSQPIEKIWIGQLAHPMNLWGARVTYEPEAVDGSHATIRRFVVRIPGKTIRKFYPSFDTEGYGYRFEDGEFVEPKLYSESVRAFPLAGRKVYLKIEDPLDYDTVFALLKAVESGSWKPKEPASRQNKDGSFTVHYQGAPVSAEDLGRIDSIRRDKPDGPIRIQTRERAFGGKVFEFEFRDGGFLFTGISSWVS